MLIAFMVNGEWFYIVFSLCFGMFEKCTVYVENMVCSFVVASDLYKWLTLQLINTLEWWCGALMQSLDFSQDVPGIEL